MDRSQYTLRANSNFSHIRCPTLTVDYPSAMLNLRRKLLTTIGIVGSRDFPAGRARASLTCLHLSSETHAEAVNRRDIFERRDIFGPKFTSRSKLRPKISRRSRISRYAD